MSNIKITTSSQLNMTNKNNIYLNQTSAIVGYLNVIGHARVYVIGRLNFQNRCFCWRSATYCKDIEGLFT